MFTLSPVISKRLTLGFVLLAMAATAAFELWVHSMWVALPNDFYSEALVAQANDDEAGEQEDFKLACVVGEPVACCVIRPHSDACWGPTALAWPSAFEITARTPRPSSRTVGPAEPLRRCEGAWGR